MKFHALPKVQAQQFFGKNIEGPRVKFSEFFLCQKVGIVSGVNCSCNSIYQMGGRQSSPKLGAVLDIVDTFTYESAISLILDCWPRLA